MTETHEDLFEFEKIKDGEYFVYKRAGQLKIKYCVTWSTDAALLITRALNLAEKHDADELRRLSQ